LFQGHCRTAVGAFANGDTRAGWLLLVLASLIALYGSKGFRRPKSTGLIALQEANTTEFLSSFSDQSDVIDVEYEVASYSTDRLGRPFEPPTPNQREFCRRLGIRVESWMGKWDVSDLIDAELQRRKQS